jgi:hypothetical protein
MGPGGIQICGETRFDPSFQIAPRPVGSDQGALHTIYIHYVHHALLELNRPTLYMEHLAQELFFWGPIIGHYFFINGHT